MTQDQPPKRPDTPDRRRRDLPFWDLRRMRGRRRRDRCAEDLGRPYLVDRVSWQVFAMASLVLVLTIVDGLITFALLDQGCEEINPVMRLLLKHGIAAFFVGKYVLTALFLPVALVMNQYRLFGTRVRVGHFIPVVAGLYVVLIAYQVGLLQQRRSAPAWPLDERAAPIEGRPQ